MNFKGDRIFSGVEDDGIISGITRPSLEEWVMNKVRQHSSTERLSENQLTRTIQWDFSPQAVRESAINAFTHRDWTRPTDVEVVLFEDCMEIISPGSLSNNVTVERMKQGFRIPRNYRFT